MNTTIISPISPISTSYPTLFGKGKIYTNVFDALVVVGFGEAATFYGSDMNTTIIHRGQGGDLRALLGDGDNRVFSGSGNDSIYCGDGNNFVSAGFGNDMVVGGGGTNYLDGGFGDDVLIAGSGSNYLYGGYGNDTIMFGGDDIATGGQGQDHFIIVEQYDEELKGIPSTEPVVTQLFEELMKLVELKSTIMDLSFLDGDVLDLTMLEGVTRENLHQSAGHDILNIDTGDREISLYVGDALMSVGGIDSAIWLGVLLVGGVNGGSYGTEMF